MRRGIVVSPGDRTSEPDGGRVFARRAKLSAARSANMKMDTHIEMSEGAAIALCTVFAAVIFAIDSVIPLGVAGGVPYIVVVLAALWSPKRRLIWYVSVATSILTIIGFVSSPAGGELWKVIFNRSLALFAIWTTAILSSQRRQIQEQKDQAVSELRVLTGLLPICAVCKKIRDDEGSWSQMESYIRHHSEASFSHSYCPECAEKALAEIDGAISEE